MTAPTITRQMVLRRAAEILQANGRTVGLFFKPVEGKAAENCPVCMAMAIGLAAGCNLQLFALGDGVGDDPAELLAVDAIRAVCAHLGLATPDDGDGVINTLSRWHDGVAESIALIATTQTPTDAQVIAALTDTADALDAQEAS